MYTIKIKPMSVNEAWQGKRYKTAKYKQYEINMMIMLPSKQVIPEGHLALLIEIGVSKTADIDNICKPFIDILQKRYGFDDNRILLLQVHKIPVKKGNEFISFDLQPYPC